MVKAKDVIGILEDFAPLSIQEEWDNSGLMIGDPEREVSGVLLSLDCTHDVIEEALYRGAGMIITHHPLIFRGIKAIKSASCLDRMIVDAIKNDLIIYSAHTNMDKIREGVSGIMAQKLDLQNIDILDKTGDGIFGMGVVGDLAEPLEIEDLCKMVKDKFFVETLKISKPLESSVSRIALCGGSGSSLIKLAVKSGAQVYISGDIPYHDFFCEPEFMVMDIGHYESEVGVLDLFSSVLSGKIANFAVYVKKNNNPIYYR